ncbi:MAG: hypothetical protein ABR591_11800 [Candidatus Velthaea sp.]
MRRRSAEALMTVALALPLLAAAPAAHSTAPPPLDVTKVQPKALLPHEKLHTEYIVEINKLGQVTRVRNGKGSRNVTFNAQTYGNALQAFIRTPDGKVVLGTYRLTYDYDPKTSRVRRDVELLKRGGVNGDTRGAAVDMLSKAHPHTPPPSTIATPAPNPAPSVNIQRMPDLNNIMKPKPSAKPTAH